MAKRGFGFLGAISVFCFLSFAEDRNDFELSEDLKAAGVQQISLSTQNALWVHGINDLIANSKGQLADLKALIDYHDDVLHGFRNSLRYPGEAVRRLLEGQLSATTSFSLKTGGFSLLQIVFIGVDLEALEWIVAHQPDASIHLNGQSVYYALDNGKGRSVAERTRIQALRTQFLRLYFSSISEIPPQDLAITLKYLVDEYDLSLLRILIDAGVNRSTKSANPDDFFSTDPDTEVGKFLQKRYPGAFALLPENAKEKCAEALSKGSTEK